MEHCRLHEVQRGRYAALHEQEGEDQQGRFSPVEGLSIRRDESGQQARRQLRDSRIVRELLERARAEAPGREAEEAEELVQRVQGGSRRAA